MKFRLASTSGDLPEDEWVKSRITVETEHKSRDYIETPRVSPGLIPVKIDRETGKMSYHWPEPKKVHQEWDETRTFIEIKDLEELLKLSDIEGEIIVSLDKYGPEIEIYDGYRE